MQNTGARYIKITTWLFASIWTRKPVIIYSKDRNHLHDFLHDLIRFIPKYRQAVLMGDFPKKVQFELNKPKVISKSSLPEMQEMLFNIFEEEKSVESRSLQLLVCEPSAEFIKQVLAQLERGWIVTTSVAPHILKDIFPETTFEVYSLSENLEVIFVAGRPYRVPIELEIMKTFISRSPIAAAFLIQKKIHEIKFIADAIVSEIGIGKKFHQVELQELFELDNQSFEKCMQIIEAEFHLDINRYITRTSNQIKKILRKMLEIEGVSYACTFRNQQLTGIIKRRPDIPFPIVFFKKLMRTNQRLLEAYLPGDLEYVVFEMNRKTKVIFLSDQIKNSRSQICFGFFISPKIPVPSFIREVTQMIETLATE